MSSSVRVILAISQDFDDEPLLRRCRRHRPRYADRHTAAIKMLRSPARQCCKPTSAHDDASDLRAGRFPTGLKAPAIVTDVRRL